MEKELSNFIMVWSSILLSSCYCYGIAKLVPKATIRFLMFLPVLCLHFILPLKLNSLNFIITITFFVTWLSTFKLLLLVFGMGPLSDPSLSLFHFVLISCFPLKLQHPTTSKAPPIKDKKPQNRTNFEKSPLNDQKNKVPSSSLHLAINFLLLILLIRIAFHKDKLPRHVFVFLICIYVYIAIEVLLGTVALIGQFLLGTEVEPPFLQPYLSTSLQDFWGRRWNRISSSILRLAIFDPILRVASRFVDRKWAAFWALMGTFVVSDLMHEVMFYYLGRVRFGWGTPLFFLLHGLCVVVESIIKSKIDGKWKLPQIIMGPLVFGFAICTFMWMVLPELLEYNVDDIALEEYAALGGFVKNYWSKMGCDYLVRYL